MQMIDFHVSVPRQTQSHDPNVYNSYCQSMLDVGVQVCLERQFALYFLAVLFVLRFCVIVCGAWLTLPVFDVVGVSD
jgi:hypothetical protein